MARSIGHLPGGIGQITWHIGHFAEFIGIWTQFNIKQQPAHAGQAAVHSS
ncbi:hypothetical protein [Sporosarcina koreensis]|nr:hypothetical protein [Sporosarcina koreensis]